MTRMLKEEAQKFFEPYLEIIKRCVRPALDAYSEYPAGCRAIHTARTKANIIRDHMVDLALREFSGLPGVSIIIKRGYVLIYLRGRALLRFKKLGRGKAKLSQNYPTKQARDFASNSVLIPELPIATKFDVGYSLNKLKTWWETISISCPGSEPYSFDIEFSGAQDMFVGEAPTEITPPPTGETAVRPRTDEKETGKKANPDGNEGG
jgi:hypothetical protein